MGIEISYQRCSDVEDRFSYQAFMDGFSDYMVKFQFTQEDFINRFFGPEGNSREVSFVAFDQDQPVGVILGGIKNFESIKTMRCGTLAIHPDYRGSGVSQRLFDLHKEEAVNKDCKQLFLEVIVGNDRAINFYQRLGYEKVYDIVYYTQTDLSQLPKECHHIFWVDGSFPGGRWQCPVQARILTLRERCGLSRPLSRSD